MDSVPQLLRQFAIDTLRKYEHQISACMDKLTEDQIWERDNQHANTIGNLILHLDGNLGQYVVSSIGGTPDTRERDAEFNASGGASREELKTRLSARVAECIEIIRTVSDARLTEEVIAQGKPLAVGTIIFKIVEHFALHTGQIMLRTKQYTQQELGFTTHTRSASS